MRHTLTAGMLAVALASLPAGLPLMPFSGSLAGAAAAQGSAAVVHVNDNAITRYQIDQRLRFLQALRAPDATPEGAEENLINERLQTDEARRLGITASEQAVQAGMTEFAGRANMDAASFTAELANAGIAADTFRDFITAGVLWREVIKARIAPNIDVSDREVNQTRKRALQEKKVTDVLLSEIIMAAPEGSEERIAERAAELTQSISSEAQFAAAARRWSAAPTADGGGRLPWTSVASLPQGLAPILADLQPGQMTAPLSVPGAVVLFYLRDTRGVTRPGANDETVEYLRLTVASAAEAAQVQAEATSCGMLYVAARGRPVEQQILPTGSVPGDIGAVLSSLDPDESAAINRGGAVDVVMLCKRVPTLLAENLGNDPIPGLPGAQVADGAAAVTPLDGMADDGFAPPPSDEQARDAIFNEKVTQAAETLLAELRANAIIRRP